MNYNKTMELYIEVNSKSTIGEMLVTKTYSKTLPCILQLLTGIELNALGIRGLYASHRVFAPICTADWLYIDSKWYRVVYIDNVQGRNHHSEIYCISEDLT